MTPDFYKLYEAERRRSVKERIAIERQNGEMAAWFARLGRALALGRRNRGTVLQPRAPASPAGSAAEQIRPQEVTTEYPLADRRVPG